MDDNQVCINADEYSLVPINKHNFEKEKNDIEAFSKKVPSEISFTHVEVDGGLFGWGDHKVTGTEMNNFIGNVQNKLIDVNKIIRNIYIGFQDVYEVLDVLDAEYLVGITKNSESAFKASQQALKAQQDIMVTVGNLKKTVEKLCELQEVVKSANQATGLIRQDITALQQYRAKLEAYKHLRDVDNMWGDVDGHKTDLAKLHQQVDGFIESANKATDLIKQDVSSLQQYRSKLETYKHLRDVDNMWSEVEAHKTDLARVHQQVDGYIESAYKATDLIKQYITALQQYRSKLEAYKHLSDVDNIWVDVEGQKTDLAKFHQQVDGYIESANKATDLIKQDITTLQQYRSKLETYKHLGDVDNMWGEVEAHKTDLTKLHQQVANYISEANATHAEIKDSIRQIEEDNCSAHLKYEKKIKTAYYIGGSAIGLLIINYILQILEIL